WTRFLLSYLLLALLYRFGRTSCGPRQRVRSAPRFVERSGGWPGARRAR
ncbi:MAG: hypothetical protein AVDCRST_MAG25-2456, partial [uncultured Rubrobacteraceae bacterium]